MRDEEPRVGALRVDSDGVLPSVEELVLEHDGQLGQIRADIDGLAGLVGDLIRPSGEAAPWNWKESDDPAAAILLTELRKWVDWYNGRCGVTADSRIPGCWYRHGPVVKELTCLWVGWRAAYYGRKTPNAQPHPGQQAGSTISDRRVGAHRGCQHPSEAISMVQSVSGLLRKTVGASRYCETRDRIA